MKDTLAEPLVSVVVPTYKRSEHLSRAVDSLLAQTYQNIEIILVDDNPPESTERQATRARVETYLEDPRVRYLSTAGATGGGHARNIGIRHCTGEYVAFLDDDDRFLPDKIESQLRFMQASGLDMSYQDVQWFDEQERLVELRKMDRVKEFTREGLLRAHITYAIAPTSIYMIRRDALLRTEGFGEVRRGQDFILMLRCIEAGLKIGYMPGVHVVQYLHGGERISVGAQLIEAQTEIYALMKRYEAILTPGERRYVDFRYNCVCAFACARGKMPGRAIPYALKAALVSPADCVAEGVRMLRGRRVKSGVHV
jgi:glycosyltransferase involved in cell wall biosynthesis